MCWRGAGAPAGSAAAAAASCLPRSPAWGCGAGSRAMGQTAGQAAGPWGRQWGCLLMQPIRAGWPSPPSMAVAITRGCSRAGSGATASLHPGHPFRTERRTQSWPCSPARAHTYLQLRQINYSTAQRVSKAHEGSTTGQPLLPTPPAPRSPCPIDPLPTEVQVLLAMPLPQLAQLRPSSRARLAQRSVLTGAGRVLHSLRSARRRMGLGREVAAAPAGSACGSGAGTALPLQLQAQKWLSAVVSGNS